jgi:hypothetical protein
MCPDDIEDRLAELEAARELTREKLNQSESVIDAIDEKIDSLKHRQIERLKADERVDDVLVQQLTTDKPVNLEDTQTGSVVPDAYVEIIVQHDGTSKERVHQQDS